jgi:hypothetical protein
MLEKKMFATFILCALAGLTPTACGGGDENADTQRSSSSAPAADSSKPSAQRTESAGRDSTHQNGSGANGSGTAGNDLKAESPGTPAEGGEAEGGEAKGTRPTAPRKRKENKAKHVGADRSADPTAENGDEPKPISQDPATTLSDEEVCERDPSVCAPDKDATPDYSNPDVRRAEERAAEPDKPTKCDSTDCEALREAER